MQCPFVYGLFYHIINDATTTSGYSILCLHSCSQTVVIFCGASEMIIDFFFCITNTAYFGQFSRSQPEPLPLFFVVVVDSSVTLTRADYYLSLSTLDRAQIITYL